MTDLIYFGVFMLVWGSLCGWAEYWMDQWVGDDRSPLLFHDRAKKPW